MGEKLPAMMRTDDVTSRACDATEGGGRPRCEQLDVFLHQRPHGFDGESARDSRRVHSERGWEPMGLKSCE
jgi:hypothetical protein